MAKIALVSADESHLQYLAGLITQAANHVVQRTCTAPSRALTQPGLGQGVDLLILDAATFSADDLQQVRRLTNEHPDTLCMLLTEAPSADLLMRAMRAGVQCVLPWPPDAQEFRDELQRCTSHALSSARNDGQVVSFLSCRGGSGTTFTAANFAHILSARHGKHVLLVDLCQQYGDAAFLVTDQSPPATLANVCNQIDRLDAALFDACLTHVSQGFDVLAGAGDPIKGGEIKAVHLERILTLAASMYDVVVFDVGQDINPASIVVLDHSNLIYAVLQLNLSYLRAGRRLMEICHSLGYRAERLRLVLNQLDKRLPISQHTMEAAFGMSVAHMLPYDPGPVRDAVTQGLPVLQVAENSPIARALTDMARHLFPDTQHRRDGLLRKLFGQSSQVPAPARA
ncbi:CpaE family protein [Ralstonia insidiosa]|uniref:Pilus assembly protein n=1 Tax=Ralstonia insidiosa TaxID=190721 RepID=A0A191ZTZ1_9RALS|nr:CpaE family protein [Ralstonia insidiosa]ANJ71547.1 pilus assembly protein [Ralstonia insidiosa]KAB0472146.1 AAA family ATPase [Ralstonia insidiosa]MBY4908277.1 CpaE family protein [Ralstonia insidiosa]